MIAQDKFILQLDFNWIVLFQFYVWFLATATFQISIFFFHLRAPNSKFVTYAVYVAAKPCLSNLFFLLTDCLLNAFLS